MYKLFQLFKACNIYNVTELQILALNTFEFIRELDTVNVTIIIDPKINVVLSVL